MTIKELDYIETQSGKKGTVVLIYSSPKVAYEVEFDGQEETETIEPGEIKKVLYSH
jgi:hypothetical protein